jgi:hypothetical protein
MFSVTTMLSSTNSPSAKVAAVHRARAHRQRAQPVCAGFGRLVVGGLAAFGPISHWLLHRKQARGYQDQQRHQRPKQTLSGVEQQNAADESANNSGG